MRPGGKSNGESPFFEKPILSFEERVGNAAQSRLVPESVGIRGSSRSGAVKVVCSWLVVPTSIQLSSMERITSWLLPSALRGGVREGSRARGRARSSTECS